MTSEPAGPRGAIHDVGYARYVGARRPPSRRFLVVARNVVAMAWRSRWGVKLPLLLALLITIGAAVAMWIMRDQLAMRLRAGGVPLPRPDAIVHHASGFYGFVGFLLATVVGCAAVADDLRAGAFAFYFSRPLRPRDYVAGKLLGIAVVLAIPLLGGPLVLALLRLLLADGWGEVWAHASIVPRALALGLVATATYALPAAALGALIARRQAAQGLFAVWYLVLGEPRRRARLRAGGAGAAPPVAAGERGQRGARPVRDRSAARSPPAWAAATATAGLALLAAAIVWRRVRRAEAAGVGGGG